MLKKISVAAAAAVGLSMMAPAVAGASPEERGLPLLSGCSLPLYSLGYGAVPVVAGLFVGIKLPLIIAAPVCYQP